MTIDWCVPSDSILRHPTELYLSVYSIVDPKNIRFIIHIEYHIVASENVADFRAGYLKYNDY